VKPDKLVGFAQGPIEHRCNREMEVGEFRRAVESPQLISIHANAAG
jgi:hypothetical protein